MSTPESITLTVGTGADCEVRVTDDYASTRHARLTIRSDRRILLEDLGSTNGTWIGTMRVYGPQAVTLGTAFRVGRTTIAVADILRAAAA